MSSRIFAIATAATMTLTGVAVGAVPASASASAHATRSAAASVPKAAAPTPVASGAGASPAALLGELASAQLTPAQAVAQAVSEASANGISTHISVTNRSTGAVLAQSGNAGTQVASESVVKLMIASYYLVLVGGYQNQSSSVLSQLSYMIRYSDDATANSYFTSSAVPTMAARYGLHATINATDRVGHWGAVRITAEDMTTFLYRAAHDPEVGPWLIPVMAQVAAMGSDGFNQAFGLNSLSGTHGSKQGWGNDEFWSSASNVINSVGYTDKYYVAILQNSYSYPDPARATATYAAKTIQTSVIGAKPAPVAPKEGDFVRSSAAIGIYRIAGGAPILLTSWSGFGGSQPVKTISAAQWHALRTLPVDGTFLRATWSGQVFRVVGGAAVAVSSWTPFGGAHPTITVDALAIARARQTVALSHLNYYPANGVVLRVGNGLYRMAGGAPLAVTDLKALTSNPGVVTIDPAAVRWSGRAGVWSHLRLYPANGTFLESMPNGKAYQVRSDRAVQIGHNSGTAVKINQATIARAGGAPPFNHLR